MSEPKRYQPVVQCVEPSYQAQMIEPKVMEFSEGEYVLHSDYARLKAECQARQAENSVLAVECDSLKAEVERLTSDLQMEKENEDRLVREWQKANNEVYGLQRQVAALIDDQTRLKTEVERLTKAGDAMAKLLSCCGNPQSEVRGWNAAKGVQS